MNSEQDWVPSARASYRSEVSVCSASWQTRSWVGGTVGLAGTHPQPLKDRCPANTSSHASGRHQTPSEEIKACPGLRAVIIGPRRGRDPGLAATWGSSGLHLRHTCVCVERIHQTETSLVLYSESLRGPGSRPNPSHQTETSLVLYSESLRGPGPRPNPSHQTETSLVLYSESLRGPGPWT